ncbi:MAG TPA: DMT family transporter [Burkholderiales bacterium]|nr:DMT family transporter [Burkholderiales bacterium]
MLYAKLVLMALFWSGVFPAINIVLQGFGIFTSVFIRHAIAAALLFALMFWREGRLRRLSPREAVMVVGLGLFGITMYNSLFTWGLSLVEASRAALIVPTNPAFTALFAVIFLKERFGLWRAVGVALSVCGALWVLARGDPGAFLTFEFTKGELILVLCIFMWSAYTILGRIALSTLSPLALTAYVMLAGGVPTAIPAWFEHSPLTGVPWKSWAAMAYLIVFGTVIPFLWFSEGVKALGAARAAQFISLVPPLAVAESVLLLGEPFTPAMGVGTLLVVVGLYLTNRPVKGGRPAPPLRA